MTDLEKTSSENLVAAGDDGVAAVRYALMQMMDRAQALADAGDYEALITGLAPIQALLGDLRQLEREVKTHIVNTMPERSVSVEGVGTVEKLKKISRKNWDSEELLRLVVHRALVDPATGEIPASPLDAADLVMREVYACAPFTGSTGWRVTALKERGIDPDEWCDQNLEDFSLKFVKNEQVK